jgi:hypothetical protein
MIERKAFTVLKYSLLPARVRLPDGGANRRFDFDKRRQPFIARTMSGDFSFAISCRNRNRMVPTIEVANNYLIMPCSKRVGKNNDEKQ